MARYLSWQFGSRLVPGPVAVPFAGNTRLLVSPGMTGATGNIYCGLHEFHDMAFVLHLLRPKDVFVDVGANVGTYSVLAAGVAGARCVSFEPHPETFRRLLDNVRLNGLGDLVCAYNVAVGSSPSRVRFTAELDTMNYVVGATANGAASIEVELDALDAALSHTESPTVVKIDVEGFESEVIKGAGRTLGADSLLAVIIEINGSGARYGVEDDDLHRALVELGFDSFKYEPFSRRLAHCPRPTSIRGNVLYIRDASRATARLASGLPFQVLGRSL